MKSYLKFVFLIHFFLNTFSVAQLHHFLVEQSGGGTIPTQTAGVIFFIDILAKDSVNATVTSFNGTVEISSTGNLSIGAGTTGPFINGVLSGYSMKYSNTGNFIITATKVSGGESGNSNLFTVNPGVAAIIQVETNADGSGTIVPTQSINAGEQLQVYAIARDTMNNFIENISADAWSLENISGGITAGDLVSQPDNKIATLTGHLIGSAKIQATVASLISVESGIITVTPGMATKLIFLQQPTDGIAGAIITPPISVRLKDNYDNNVHRAGDTITISLLSGNGTLNGTLIRLTNDTGYTSFDDLSINQPGPKMLAASAPNLSSAVSDTFNLTTYIITATASLNGTISPAGAVAVIYNANQAFTISPNVGYHLDSLIVDGTDVDSASSYTFYNVTSNHTIRAVFKINSYTITASTGANGSITPTGAVTVEYGSNQSFEMIPSTNYHTDSVFIDGSYQGTMSVYAFENITENHSIHVTFSVDIPVVNVKIFLQGSYTDGSMTTSLQSILPKNQPYNISPWNYTGEENVASIPASVVDWMLIELRSGISSSTQVGARACFLKSDGSTVDLDGTNPVQFNNVIVGNYYITIHHRNHLAVMSAVPVTLTDSSDIYDFTTQLSKYYGNQAAILGGSKFGMFGGDYSVDGFIDSDDFIGPDNDLFQNGYLKSDHTLDGFIDSDDFIHPDNNMFKSTNVPN